MPLVDGGHHARHLHAFYRLPRKGFEWGGDLGGQRGQVGCPQGRRALGALLEHAGGESEAPKGVGEGVGRLWVAVGEGEGQRDHEEQLVGFYGCRCKEAAFCADALDLELAGCFQGAWEGCGCAIWWQ